MQLDKLTIKSQQALQEAQGIAQRHSQQEMDCEHLLLAMLGQPDSLVPELLEKVGVSPAQLRPEVEAEIARRHKVEGSSEVYTSSHLKKALESAQSEAGKLKDDYISTEHLLLGVIDEAGPQLKKILQKHGLKR